MGERHLHSRTQEILNSIVRAYIDDGEPVASRTISKKRREPLSPATIRNVMADLTEMGYLSQPHTSAGRIPTQKAFRAYVRSVNADRMSAFETGRLQAALSEASTVDERLERSSHVLTELTHNVGIAAAIPAAGQILDQVELLALADRRVLIVLVTRDHMVRNRVVTLDESVSQDDLNSIRNYVNGNFGGWALGLARRELVRRIEEERAAYDQILSKLSPLCSKGLLEVESLPEVHMEGAFNLVGLHLQLTREKMRELLHALEEKKRLLVLLDRFLEEVSNDLQVQVGLEEVHPAMGQLSLIGLSIRMPGGLSAKIAVLGPIRMHYERVMSAVLHTGRALQTSL